MYIVYYKERFHDFDITLLILSIDIIGKEKVKTLISLFNPIKI